MEISKMLKGGLRKKIYVINNQKKYHNTNILSILGEQLTIIWRNFLKVLRNKNLAQKPSIRKRMQPKILFIDFQNPEYSFHGSSYSESIVSAIFKDNLVFAENLFDAGRLMRVYRESIEIVHLNNTSFSSSEWDEREYQYRDYVFDELRTSGGHVRLVVLQGVWKSSMARLLSDILRCKTILFYPDQEPDILVANRPQRFNSLEYLYTSLNSGLSMGSVFANLNTKRLPWNSPSLKTEFNRFRNESRRKEKVTESILIYSSSENFLWTLKDSACVEIPNPTSILPSNNNLKNLGSFEQAYRGLCRSVTAGERITTFWTIRLFQALRKSKQDLTLTQYPFVSDITVGFTPFLNKIEFGQTNELPSGEDITQLLFNNRAENHNSEKNVTKNIFIKEFGIIIHIDAQKAEGSGLFNQEHPDYIVPFHVNVDEHSFPIVFCKIDKTVNCSSSNPSGGLITCKVKLGNMIGFLTAKHLVGALGTNVKMSCGHDATVMACGPEGIDAAMYSCDCLNEADLSKKPQKPVKFIAPWTDVCFYNAVGQRINTKVQSVSDTMGILNSPHLPSRIYLTQPGKPGDSGSLVREPYPSGKPVGIYIGSYRNPAGLQGGIAQHAFQAATIMGIKLYY